MHTEEPSSPTLPLYGARPLEEVATTWSSAFYGVTDFQVPTPRPYSSGSSRDSGVKHSSVRCNGYSGVEVYGHSGQISSRTPNLRSQVRFGTHGEKGLGASTFREMLAVFGPVGPATHVMVDVLCVRCWTQFGDGICFGWMKKKEEEGGKKPKNANIPQIADIY